MPEIQIAQPDDPPPSVAVCANCGEVLRGPFCYHCGQTADNHKRSILHLLWEVFEDLFHADGRLARTLPALFFRPGRLTRDYIDGRRARHMPPFRTFLAALFLFIVAAEYAIDHLVEVQHETAALLTTPEGRAAEAARVRQDAVTERDDDLKHAARDKATELARPQANPDEVAKTYAGNVADAEKEYADNLAKADAIANGTRGRGKPTGGEQLNSIIENPGYYLATFFTWAHRIAILLLPIYASILALAYARTRKFFFYDHLLVAMNLLSFAFLVNAIGFMLWGQLQFYWFALLLAWVPLNMFQTLRGTYGSSIAGALFKTLFIWLTSSAIFAALVISLMLFTLTRVVN